MRTSGLALSSAPVARTGLAIEIDESRAGPTFGNRRALPHVPRICALGLLLSSPLRLRSGPAAFAPVRNRGRVPLTL